MKLDVRLTERFESPPEDVWKALTTSETLAAWLMPNDFVPEVGSRFTFEPDHETPWEGNVQCKVLELETERRMTWSWRTSGMDRPSRVTFELVAREGATDLHFRHIGEAGGDVAEGLEGGWPKMLDRLHETMRGHER